MDKIAFAWSVSFVILICDRFSSIAGQGNRGVIVNNQKLDHSNEIDLLLPSSVSTTTTTTTTTKSLAPLRIETTAKQRINSRNSNEIYVTVPDFRPSTTAHHSFEISPTAASPSNLLDFSSIATILNQNQTYYEKIDQIVKKLNVTGGVTQINVINVNNGNHTKVRRKVSTMAPPMLVAAPMRMKDVTYVHPFTKYDSVKDSKELKVQFVLDCDLKDAMNRDAGSRRPVIRQPQHPQYIQNQQIQMNSARKTTRRPQYAYPYRPAPPPPVHPMTTTAPTTPKEQTMYVEPPGVVAVSDAFEGAYEFFENVLTEEIRKPVKRDPLFVPSKPIGKKLRRRRLPIVKRSTMRIVKEHEPTRAPEYRNTRPAYASTEKQKLTTQIHVTSEYVGKDPVVVDKDDTASDQYDDDDDGDGDNDDDDDDDDDDYDVMSFDGFGDYSGSDEDYDESESVEEYADETNAVKRKADAKRKAKRKKRPTSSSFESDEYDDRDNESGEDYDDDDDDDGGGSSVFAMPDVGEFFGNVANMFTPIGSYVPSFLFFGEEDANDDRDEDDGVNLRRTKHKKSSQRYEMPDLYLNRIEDAQEKTNRWYDRFFYGSTEDGDGTSTTPPVPTSESSESFFDWLSGDSNEIATTETASTASTDSSNHNWFTGLFGGETTTKAPPIITTTRSPLLANALQSPHQWLNLLASHMATTTVKPPRMKTETPKRVKYDDYQVWRVTPSTQAHVDFLREYKMSSDGERIHWLKGPSMRGPTDILIPPNMNKEVQESLDYESIPYDVVIWNLEQAIRYENPVLSRHQKVELEAMQGHPMTWYRYHSYEDITIFVDYLQRKYPHIVDLIHIGRSFEGRPLVVVKISFEDDEDGPVGPRKKKIKASSKSRKKKKSTKPGIFIEGGVHGREWITPAVTTWLLNELVKHNSSDEGSVEREMVRSVDWYILPVSNPDGYEYSLNYDRMWRKTRSKHPDNRASLLTLAMKWLKKNKQNGIPSCYGTDPTRNYDVKWGGVGSSKSPCSDFYAGPKAFSEPETKALSAFLMDYQNSLNLFLSLHSYGQMIAYPSTANSTFSASQRSNDLRDIAEMAVNSLRDLASSGRYSIDHSNEMLDLRSGTSTDYAMHEAGIKYSFTIELRDTGTQGFLLSPSYIDTTGLEVFEMIKAMAEYL